MQRRGEPGGPSSTSSGMDGLRDLDLALEDLARRALGEGVDEPDVTRVLVGRDARLDVVAQLGRGGGRARLERDRGPDLLAERVVRDADHGRLEHGGVLVDDLLDLARVDIEA